MELYEQWEFINQITYCSRGAGDCLRFFSSIQIFDFLLLPYISYRCKRILEVRKEAGPVLPSSIEQGVLGQNELYFFNKYGDCLTDYSSNVGLDLTANLEPPSSINIEIRVLEDCGELLTEDGRLTLKQGTTLFVKKSNVEHLIRQGKCKQL